MGAAGAFVGVGSNLGDRAAHVRNAFRRLGELGHLVQQVSSLYETEPVGGPPQGAYLNAVAEVERGRSAGALLAACLAVEQSLGRVRDVRNGPRTIDLDVLLWGDLVLSADGLVVPHPHLEERRFVLVPLCEIAAETRHPSSGRTIADLLTRCRDTSAVVRWASA